MDLSGRALTCSSLDEVLSTDSLISAGVRVVAASSALGLMVCPAVASRASDFI
jgi:hypothetical protein